MKKMADHFQPYEPRTVLNLPTIERDGWQLKRYGILAKDKNFDSETTSLALDAALARLPVAGKLDDSDGNHGIGFQIVHFAEVAVVSPVFYWMWGSVLANADQMRAPWEGSPRFGTGVSEVIGCIWEMQLVCYETESWKKTMLGESGIPNDNLTRYLDNRFPAAESA